MSDIVELLRAQAADVPIRSSCRCNLIALSKSSTTDAITFDRTEMLQEGR
jgi:hypothetical protein